MYASVLIDVPTRALDAPFTYAIPDAPRPADRNASYASNTAGEYERSAAVGDAVAVTFNNRVVIGYIVAVSDAVPAGVDPDTVLPVLAVCHGPWFRDYAVPVARRISEHYAAPLSESLRLFLPPGRKPVLRTDKLTGARVLRMPGLRRRKAADVPARTLRAGKAPRPERLSTGQTAALAAIDHVSGTARTVLLDGVTGSGKTEVYLQAIEHVLANGGSSIVLVPEISLTPQTCARFSDRLGETVAVMHSRLTPAERFAAWERLRTGDARVVVGARSALFAPMQDLRLIVIDEEHDDSYKNGQAPRYHARDVARHIAAETGATLVLGSATPSLDTRALPGIRVVRLPERVTGNRLPQVTVVDMTDEFAGGNRAMFSRQLTDALQRVHDAGEKAILLLNRRGFAQFLLCRECGYVPHCEACSVSLTYHATQNHLRCHHCDAIYPVPQTCPRCGSIYLRQFGAGTQRLADELALRWPDWQAIRMDADTTTGRGGHVQLLAQFEQLKSGVLLGTQMIAKGHDFPDVTLVGVITADISLNVPDFRAGERTWQLLQQVAGRAGRGQVPGRVIIQTYWPEHRAIRAVETGCTDDFIAAELQIREQLGYPPTARLCELVVASVNAADARSYAETLGKAFRADEALPDGMTVLGPAPAVIAKLKGKYRYHLLLKGPADCEPGPAALATLRANRAPRGVSVAVDVDPTRNL
ncbi:MAG: primosomal protein N' [Actinomycetes bacterium]|jgi:primosomal protein N' (replication factor Y)|nr:primosomal protein N' [Actinomycetes bacterium]